MPISQITPFSISGVDTPYLTLAKSLQQTAVTAAPTTAKAYSVELSDAAQVRSLKLQGFSVTMISIKLGLGASEVNQYLGITESAVTKPTYVEPKKAYTEPKALTAGRNQLTQDLSQLSIAEFTWSSMMKKVLPASSTAKPQTVQMPPFLTNLTDQSGFWSINP